MRLRYSLSLFLAQTRAWLQRLFYKSPSVIRLIRLKVLTALSRSLNLIRFSFKFLLNHFRCILWTLGSLIVFILSASLFYHYRVSATTKLYHKIFYIDPLIAQLTSQPDPILPQPEPLIVKRYEIIEGDTYWDIAKKTGVDLDTLISYNNPKDLFKVRPKEIVQVPLQDGILYTPNPDETLEVIGGRYGIAREKILYFNPNWETAETLFIPGAYFSYIERLKKLGAEFANPLSFFHLTSSFGNRIHPVTKKRSFHKGVDLRAAVGTPVYAASGGTVVVARSAHGYGNIVMIYHGNNKFTRYAHLLNFSVTVGQRVTRGQQIAQVGSSGISTGPHLHFEVWNQNKPINPIGITDFFSKPKK